MTDFQTLLSNMKGMLPMKRRGSRQLFDRSRPQKQLPSISGSETTKQTTKKHINNETNLPKACEPRSDHPETTSRSPRSEEGPFVVKTDSGRVEM